MRNLDFMTPQGNLKIFRSQSFIITVFVAITVFGTYEYVILKSDIFSFWLPTIFWGKLFGFDITRHYFSFLHTSVLGEYF